VTSRPGRPRIGFDARALAFPAGGVRRYTRELFSALPVLHPEADFVAVDPPPGIKLPPGVVRGARAFRLPTNLARMTFALPGAIRRSAVDLFHAPAYTAPLIGRCPTVLTIHDVSYERRPDFYPHALGPVRRWFYRRSAVCAARIITDSEFSRAEISAAYGIAASRVDAIPLGVGAPFVGAPPSGVASLAPGVRPPYVLHVGDLHPRRDLLTALRAVLGIRSRAWDAVPTLRLVCAGVDRGSAETLCRAAADAGAPEAVVLLGPVSENDLVSLYQHAAVLVYPSLYEGFGLPVLEAMACGLPVVAANAGSVPEVLGNAGILVACGDGRAMASAVREIISRPDHRAALGARGRERSKLFSWVQTAQATFAVYRSLLGVP